MEERLSEGGSLSPAFRLRSRQADVNLDQFEKRIDPFARLAERAVEGMA